MDNVQKQFGRKRVFAFLALFFLVTMLLEGIYHSTTYIQVIEDAGIAVFAFLVLLYLAVMRKRVDMRSLRVQNNIAFVLFIAVLAFLVFGLIMERGANDLIGKMPMLIGIIITFANRFV